MIFEIVQFATCFSLGILLGSLLTEATILVPYWRTMNAKVFLNLHHTLGPKLFSYFAPLTIIATIFPVLTALFSLVLEASLNWLILIPAIILLIMLLIYFVYFKGANESFKTGSVSAEGLAEELKKWAKWHWLRCVLCIIAFFFSLLAIT